jgi:hypothetical protein
VREQPSPETRLCINIDGWPGTLNVQRGYGGSGPGRSGLPARKGLTIASGPKNQERFGSLGLPALRLKARE